MSKQVSLIDSETIKFYRANDKNYGFLSNLYKKPITFEGREFPNSEYAYQFGKYSDKATREWAMSCPKSHLLAIISHNLLSWDIVKGWSKIRFNRMYEVLKEKFSAAELKKKLIDTKDAILIEDSKTDNIWGIGKSGTGKNMLGKLLMKIREELKDAKKN